MILIKRKYKVLYIIKPKIYKQEFERMSEISDSFPKITIVVLDVFNEFPFEFNYKIV